MAIALIWRGMETIYCVATVYSTKFSSGVELLECVY